MWNLIALGIVIVATLILIAGVLYYFHNSNQQSQASQTVAEINEIVGNIDSLYQGYNNGYSAISTANLIKANAFPKNMVVGDTSSGTGTAVDDVWGGAVTVAAGDTGGANPAGEFTITINGVPAKACENVVVQLEENAAQIAVAGTALTTPVDPTALAGDCATAGQGASGGNVIAFSYS